ncbi:hypothetical protein [Corynebacterium rouxii]|uniref:DivIVA domain-containing protein n=1 Tax=Corynebacterium rouxii TaxID=2719119 RepID=A0A6I8MAN7_9CORY|nr:hypothetical protein [Corynebacterium rouxii]MDT9408600.1 hypothetical protein [Corynebacterium rouxii]MDT9410780.1 hypothetical protein [Corynebacterium rouxii]VZH84959.1 hypothetical protein FRC0190_00947 [Corynebacterium rouxii]
MLWWIVLLLVMLMAVVVLTFAFGSVFGRGDGVELPEVDRLTALNEQAVRRGVIDDVRFDSALWGYNQQQVDCVIAALESEIDQLKGQTRGFK